LSKGRETTLITVVNLLSFIKAAPDRIYYVDKAT